MGCSEWKAVRFKVRSFPAGRSVNTADRRLLEGSNRPPGAEQLLQRVGQLKLDAETGSDRSDAGSPPSGRLATLFQSVIL